MNIDPYERLQYASEAMEALSLLFVMASDSDISLSKKDILNLGQLFFLITRELSQAIKQI